MKMLIISKPTLFQMHAQKCSYSLTTGLSNELGQETFVAILFAHYWSMQQRRHFFNISKVLCRTAHQVWKNFQGFLASFFISFNHLCSKQQTLIILPRYTFKLLLPPFKRDLKHKWKSLQGKQAIPSRKVHIVLLCTPLTKNYLEESRLFTVLWPMNTE